MGHRVHSSQAHTMYAMTQVLFTTADTIWHTKHEHWKRRNTQFCPVYSPCPQSAVDLDGTWRKVG